MNVETPHEGYDSVLLAEDVSGTSLSISHTRYSKNVVLLTIHESYGEFMGFMLEVGEWESVKIAIDAFIASRKDS